LIGKRVFHFDFWSFFMFEQGAMRVGFIEGPNIIMGSAVGSLGLNPHLYGSLAV
jgi:hypothetical protein